MQEQRFSPPLPGVWPGLPDQDRRLADIYGCPAAIADVVSVIGDTRRLILISGGLLAADLIGTGSVVSALLNRGHVLALAFLLLLVPVLLGWLVTAVVVLLAERPVAGALGGLRRATGAPIDLSAPWLPLGVRPLAPSDLDWGHVVPLIAAANCQHARARFALSASILTTAAFILWMSITLAAAMLT